ncbi:hypothetical protein [Acidimangrovimonas pyrenivorans]|uniref:Uncharacterized protein n=1 Tax=Acidimangrovimonas pyrenivorans TaxID=2030798 RepID=A0ABV7AFR7_9RHOB
MPKQTCGRQDLPHLSALLDRVAVAAQAPVPDRVWFDGDDNAFAATLYPFFGRRRRLHGIGLALWKPWTLGAGSPFSPRNRPPRQPRRRPQTPAQRAPVKTGLSGWGLERVKGIEPSS